MMMKLRQLMKRNLRNNEKGFTLIELLVVVVILGILAAVIIPNVTDSRDDAEAAADDANLKILQSAVDRYYIDKGQYPSELDDLEGNYIRGDVPTAKQSGKYFKYSSSDGVVTLENK